MKDLINLSLWETEDLFLLEVKDDLHQPLVILGDQEGLTQINLKGREVQLQIMDLAQEDFCHSHLKNGEGAPHPDLPTREVQHHLSMEDQEDPRLHCFQSKMNLLLDFISKVSHNKV